MPEFAEQSSFGEKERSVRWPDFIVVGPPKSGTTSLDHYLNQHPQVFVAGPKEMHFFGKDLMMPPPRVGKDEYLSRFANRSEQVVGEDSAWYMYSKTAAEEIYEANAETKIITQLRNPVDMLPSLHSQYVFSRNEDILDFATALEAEADRKAGRRTGSAYYVEGLYYREMVRYADQLERFIKVFGRTRVHVNIFDDLLTDPASLYRKTLEFLGVDSTFQARLGVHRRNKTRRRFPPIVGKVANTVLPDWIRGRAYQTVGISYKKRQPLDTRLLRALKAEFAPDIRRLSDLIGRDLSHWCTP